MLEMIARCGLVVFPTSAQHLRGWDERRGAIAQAAEKAGRTRDLLARYGIDCPTVTGARTPRRDIAAQLRGLRVGIGRLHQRDINPSCVNGLPYHCGFPEIKIVCQQIRYSLRSPKRAARSSIRPRCIHPANQSRIGDNLDPEPTTLRA